MSLPSKSRFIGAAYPGAEAFVKLVQDRYSLATMLGMTPDEFLRATAPWASLDAYNAWLAAYKANAGSFLDHVVWGADRDIGGTYLYGAMDDRYASNASRLGLTEAMVKGKRCCVVGAWDGTECLLLHALGAASVDAIEEVDAFRRMTELQLSAWEVPHEPMRLMEVFAPSLYQANVHALWQRYDFLYVPGVLYHLTDLPTALLILWALLKPGGVLAFESIAYPHMGAPTARYLGASIPGWNWWGPTPDCYEALLRDCGFPDGRTVELSGGRGWWIGTRSDKAPPAIKCGAAGFSRPELLAELRGLLR